MCCVNSTCWWTCVRRACARLRFGRPFSLSVTAFIEEGAAVTTLRHHHTVTVCDCFHWEKPGVTTLCNQYILSLSVTAFIEETITLSLSVIVFIEESPTVTTLWHHYTVTVCDGLHWEESYCHNTLSPLHCHCLRWPSLKRGLLSQNYVTITLSLSVMAFIEERAAVTKLCHHYTITVCDGLQWREPYCHNTATITLSLSVMAFIEDSPAVTTLLHHYTVTVCGGFNWGATGIATLCHCYTVTGLGQLAQTNHHISSIKLSVHILLAAYQLGIRAS